MDIPINVEVLCAGKECGRSTYLVINPISERVTHLVVSEKAFPYIERLVPVDKILASSPNSIQLRCSQTDLSNMDTFEETDFIEAGQLETSLPYSAPYEVWPCRGGLAHHAQPWGTPVRRHLASGGVGVTGGADGG